MSLWFSSNAGMQLSPTRRQRERPHADRVSHAKETSFNKWTIQHDSLNIWVDHHRRSWDRTARCKCWAGVVDASLSKLVDKVHCLIKFRKHVLHVLMWERNWPASDESHSLTVEIFLEPDTEFGISDVSLAVVSAERQPWGWNPLSTTNPTSDEKSAHYYW